MFSETIQAVIDRVDRLRNEVDDHWQLPRDEATLLAHPVGIRRCGAICEIGMSDVVPMLPLAAAARRTGRHAHPIDQDPRKVAAAMQNLRDAGLDAGVTLHQGDAREILASLRPATPFDF